MVPALHNLREGALAQNLHYLVAVGNVPTDFHFVIALNVVEDRIALELSVIAIPLLLLLFLIEGLYSVVFHIL